MPRRQPDAIDPAELRRYLATLYGTAPRRPGRYHDDGTEVHGLAEPTGNRRVMPLPTLDGQERPALDDEREEEPACD